MAFRDEYDFSVLINEAENMVIDELGRQLEAYDGELCRCTECVLDMAALAFNSVSPLYRVSLLGTLYTQAMSETAYARSVEEGVSGAIEKVRNNPAHD